MADEMHRTESTGAHDAKITVWYSLVDAQWHYRVVTHTNVTHEGSAGTEGSAQKQAHRVAELAN